MVIPDETPLTSDELDTLWAFLKEHHPPMAGDIERLYVEGVIPLVPMLCRTLWEEMHRFLRGEPTRYIEFRPKI